MNKRFSNECETELENSSGPAVMHASGGMCWGVGCPGYLDATERGHAHVEEDAVEDGHRDVLQETERRGGHVLVDLNMCTVCVCLYTLYNIIYTVYTNIYT